MKEYINGTFTILMVILQMFRHPNFFNLHEIFSLSEVSNVRLHSDLFT